MSGLISYARLADLALEFSSAVESYDIQDDAFVARTFGSLSPNDQRQLDLLAFNQTRLEIAQGDPEDGETWVSTYRGPEETKRIEKIWGIRLQVVNFTARALIRAYPDNPLMIKGFLPKRLKRDDAIALRQRKKLTDLAQACVLGLRAS